MARLKFQYSARKFLSKQKILLQNACIVAKFFCTERGLTERVSSVWIFATTVQILIGNIVIAEPTRDKRQFLWSNQSALTYTWAAQA